MHGVVSQLVAAHLQPLHDKSSLAESELTIALFEHAQPLSAELVASCGVGLEQTDAMVAHQIHQLLIHSTPAVLERRCALGWGPSYHELWA
jgi:hypothetical protein